MRFALALVLGVACFAEQGALEVRRLVAMKRYPPLARAALVQGTVELNCSITDDGAVKECRMASGHPLLFAAALENLKAWTFKRGPGSRVADDVTVVYTFELVGAPVRDEPKTEFSFEYPNHARFVSQPACADHVPCTPEEKMRYQAERDAPTQVRGAVADSSGTPISGATVLIHWDSAASAVGLADDVGITSDLAIRTKENGTFSVDLPPGFYDVFVAAQAFTPTARKIRTKGGKSVEIKLRMEADPLFTAEMGNRVEAVRPATPRQKK